MAFWLALAAALTGAWLVAGSKSWPPPMAAQPPAAASSSPVPPSFGPSGDMSMFVRRQGYHFHVGGRRWLFAGSNQYYLMTKAADPGQAHLVTDVLDDCESLGLTVIRTWAFADGPHQGALQPYPGELEESTFKGLDRVISEAGKRGIRVMLSFVNYWTPYGGVDQYVRWSKTASRRKDFFYDESCQSMYRNFVRAVIMRKNTVTGTLYRDEPAIFAWELINEGRCPEDTTGDTFHHWVARMSEYVKSLDGNHLLTVGTEGFWGPSNPQPFDPSPNGTYQHALRYLVPPRPGDTPAGLARNYVPAWMGRGQEGTDFVRNHDLPYVDFLAAHMYLDDWGYRPRARPHWTVYVGVWVNKIHEAETQSVPKEYVLASYLHVHDLDFYPGSTKPAIPPEEYAAFARQWVVTHLLASERLRKPFLMTEFGARRDPSGFDVRNEIFSIVFSVVHQSAGAGRTAGGSLFWILSASGYKDFDGYTVYTRRDQGPGHGATLSMIKEHARAMRALSGAPGDADPSR